MNIITDVKIRRVLFYVKRFIHIWRNTLLMLAFYIHKNFIPFDNAANMRTVKRFSIFFSLHFRYFKAP